MNARRAAADIVIAVLERGRTMEDALAGSPHFEALEGRDRAFARAIASTTLRRLGAIDAVITTFLERALPSNADAARALLRTGAAQLLFLGTPAHAAVSETVALARSHRALSGFAGLINAVLRRIAAEGPVRLAALEPGADLPAWLFTRWRAAYGEETAQAMAAALQREAPLDLTCKRDPQSWALQLGGAVLGASSVRLSHGALGGVDTLVGFNDGAWWVQDAAAAMPAQLLGDVAGKRVLDLCAAPGGKTLQLAAAGARVTALDRDAERLKRVRAGLDRTRLDAEIICADALDWTPAGLFDAVLLDAPCTATGAMRRHPDIAWLRRPGDINQAALLQQRLLQTAASFVRPGGMLVYAVCSLEPEEGESVVAQANEAWAPSKLSGEDIPALFVTEAGHMRTLPSHWADEGGLDGFFAARLLRR